MSDIVTHLDGDRVHRSGEMRQAIRQLKPGARVSLSVMRDGRAFSTTVRLGESGSE